MSQTKVWKLGERSAPKFPQEYAILRSAVLQATDIRSNHNKYYALELHQARGAPRPFRLFTHYGRTDDLETNPEAGQKECRYFTNLVEAEVEYASIYRQKTSPAKGYQEVSLAAARIGSARARGQRVGATEELAPPPVASPRTSLAPALARLVGALYHEATSALTSTVAATITARGIETPLGVLTPGQIDKGEAILGELYEVFQKRRKNRQHLIDLSGAFYSAIPHRIGRSREAVEGAVIDSLDAFEQKQETLRLMRDMLLVNGERGRVLYDDDLDAKYQALRCEIAPINPGSGDLEAIARKVIEGQVRDRKIAVKGVYRVRRAGEHEAYDGAVGNEQVLFHGSRVKNWVGILTRGLVMPRIAVSMGIRRTDAGWLGNGIYFSQAPCAAVYYTSTGRDRTRFMALASVALGRPKDFFKITHGIEAPPPGFDSCHGVRAAHGVRSDFSDDEYAVYDQRRQKLEYLVEFTAV